MPEIDMSRLPYEITRAVEANGYLVETLDPGLRVIVHPETLDVVDRYGDVLGHVPLYRLHQVDPDLLQRAAAAALEDVPLHLADQLVAAMNAGKIDVSTPPDSDRVFVEVDGFGLYAAHRCVVVATWPETDQ